ncbi:MAG: threonine ammonia-lyase, biosynthetic, partial [Lentisphaeria bacterium]|nr:threonine ammonia-lyase, biosynthetic [Lentisphaeria bacterium]
LAGLKKYIETSQVFDQTLVAINSGANVNFDRLRHIAERAEAGEHKEAIFSVDIPEHPGSFRDFCLSLERHDISEFNYRFNDEATAKIFVGIKMSGQIEDRYNFVKMLQSKGYKVTDLSDNELAKLHIRHTVGGKAPQLQNEVIFRFQFPERPGALMQFLDSMADRWNCSLFHYRNHGAAFGRVMMGLQVEPDQKPEVIAFLEQLGYEFWDETENDAYQTFLG